MCFASVCLNGMDSGRKRSTTVEFDPIVLAQSARGMFSSLLYLPVIIRSCQSCRLHKNASWACFACCKLSRPPKWKFRGSVWQSQNCRGTCRKWTQPHRSDHLKEDPPASKDKIRKILLSLKKKLRHIKQFAVKIFSKAKSHPKTTLGSSRRREWSVAMSSSFRRGFRF